MTRQPQFCFNPEEGSSLCIIATKNKTYVGTAQCAKEDRDMMSEKTGCEIAYHRAIIHSLEDHIFELKNELMGLHKYYYTVNQSKYFDANSYMAQMLKRQMEQREDDIRMTKELLAQEKSYLKQYIADKGEFYTKIRNNRKANSHK